MVWPKTGLESQRGIMAKKAMFIELSQINLVVQNLVSVNLSHYLIGFQKRNVSFLVMLTKVNFLFTNPITQQLFIFFNFIFLDDSLHHK